MAAQPGRRRGIVVAYEEETRVFDVSKPGKAAPSATSKPVIVGHHPQTIDPMVKDDGDEGLLEHGKTDLPKSTSIPVFTDDEVKNEANSQKEDSKEASHEELEMEKNDELDFGSLEDKKKHLTPSEKTEESDVPLLATDSKPEDEPQEEKVPETDLSGSPLPPTTGSMIHPEDEKPAGQGGSKPPDAPAAEEMSPLHIPSGAGPRRRLPKALMWTVLGFLGLLVIGFLAIDLGLVKSDIRLPFHIFNKQKASTKEATTTPPPVAPAATPPAAKKGLEPKTLAAFQLTPDWTMHERKEVNLKFAYPKAWKLSDTTKFGQIELAFTSPDYKTIPNEDNPTQYTSEGGKFYVQVTKTTESSLEFLKGSNGYFFTAVNQLTVDKTEGLLGSCGHYEPGACAYFIQDENLYEISYYQPNREIIKQKTGKEPVTPKDKYTEDFLKLLSSLDFTAN